MSAELKESEIDFQWLPPELWHLVEPQFVEWGVPVPDPAFAAIAVAYEKETSRIAGFWVTQTVVHAEPVCIYPEFRGQDIWRGLLAKVEEPFREQGSGFYVFVPNDRPDIRHMAEVSGCKMLDWTVAMKSFEAKEK